MTKELDDATEFVNRVDELAFFQTLLPPKATWSSLVVLRAPTGFGKSRLTSELARRADRTAASVVFVDPEVRQKQDGRRIYDGFFLQRTARAIDTAARAGAAGLVPLETFLKSDRMKNLRAKRLDSDLQKLPTLSTLYSVAVEYGERLLVKGRYAPSQHLASDSRESISVCTEFVANALKSRPFLLVVREAHHIDHQSLKTLLQLNVGATCCLLILEYTDANYQFDPDHEKILLREMKGRSAYIHDLHQLDRFHFEQILMSVAPPTATIVAESYLSWNGNLRCIEQVQYRYAVGRPLAKASDLVSLVSDINTGLKAHIQELPSVRRWLLALVAAHVEAVPRKLLLSAAARVLTTETEASLTRALAELETRHRLIRTQHDYVSLAHEDVGSTMRAAPAQQGEIAKAEACLCEVYADLVEREDFTIVSLSAAARRALGLASQTRDGVLFLKLVARMQSLIREANDQTVYIDVVSEVAAKPDALDPADRIRLASWGAVLAYELNDFRTAQRLLHSIETRGPEQTTILAFCHLENGEHEIARGLAKQLRSGAANPEVALCADLIDAGADLDVGLWSRCRDALLQIVERGRTLDSPLVGHALRLLSEVDGDPDGTTHAIASVHWLERKGMPRSRAYSELSAATFLARRGAIADAMALIARAEQTLCQDMRNEHIVLNDRAFVMLLAEKPDFSACAGLLQRAIRTSRNDFSDLSILVNLAIAHWKAGAMPQAIDCVARGEAILDDPEFSERDVFWPACFNFAQILAGNGDPGAASRMRKRPGSCAWTHRSYDSYWAQMYGETTVADTTYPYLHRFDYHPCAISHWQLDYEAIEGLTQGSRG